MQAELVSKALDKRPVVAHEWTYVAEPQALPGNDEVTMRTNEWFDQLRGEFNNGVSMPVNNLNILRPRETTERYIAALGASALMHLVSEESERREIGIATKFERTVLNQWAANEVRHARGQSLESKVLEFAAFAGLETAMVAYMQKGLKAMRERLGPSARDFAIENLVAAVLAKEGINVLHRNVLAFEGFVAANATAVDSVALLPIMKNAIAHHDSGNPDPLPPTNIK